MTDKELKHEVKALLVSATIHCVTALESIDDDNWESLWSIFLVADKQLARACELIEAEKITRYPV